MGMGEDKSNGSAWLVAKARDNGESLSIERMRCSGRDSVTLRRRRTRSPSHGSANELSLKEHAIFVLSQRDDKEAVDALMQIAESDADG